MTHRPGWFAVAALLVAAPASSGAQVRASERGGVFQQVNGTTITVDYARPGQRGRTDVFGGLIPWGKVWTPGANWATTLEVDHDVMVQDQVLKKGKYAVWMEVQPTAWTVILDPKARAFHTAPPKPDSGQVRFSVTPQDGSGPEFLTWSFPEVTPRGATIRMAWAGKAVSFGVTVPSAPLPTITAQAAVPYAGSYQVIFGPGSGGRTIPTDAPTEWKVWYADGRLLADWAHPPFPAWHHMTLLTVANDWFHPGALVDGQLFDLVTDLTIEFAVADGKASGFEIRGPNDAIVGRGRRVAE